MLILFAFALLILAIAVGLLFAMCADWPAVRRRRGTVAEPVRYVRPLGRSSVYLRETAAWPNELAGLRANDDFLLVVLSTSCSTCNTICEQLGSQDWAERAEGRLGVVVSTADQEIAEEFIAKYRLNRLPCFLDVHGDWSAASARAERQSGRADLPPRRPG